MPLRGKQANQGEASCRRSLWVCRLEKAWLLVTERVQLNLPPIGCSLAGKFLSGDVSKAGGRLLPLCKSKFGKVFVTAQVDYSHLRFAMS